MSVTDGCELLQEYWKLKINLALETEVWNMTLSWSGWWQWFKCVWICVCSYPLHYVLDCWKWWFKMLKRLAKGLYVFICVSLTRAPCCWFSSDCNLDFLPQFKTKTKLFFVLKQMKQFVDVLYTETVKKFQAAEWRVEGFNMTTSCSSSLSISVGLVGKWIWVYTLL